MSNHDHSKCLLFALTKAEQRCKDNEQQLTPIRKKVFELIWSDHKPFKAYDLLEKMKVAFPNAQPPTVYRALDFLEKNGLIHKIESLNAFVGCNQPHQVHTCCFLICEKCNCVEEFPITSVQAYQKEVAQRSGFLINKSIFEIFGLCKQCQENSSELISSD